MARTWFSKAPNGFRLARGDVIRRLQVSLKAQGANGLDADGVFGADSEAAVKAWQAGHGLAPSGKVTEETWTGLMGAAPPDIFERCLQLTADYEGTGYTRAVGNFDGAWFTWGIIGFTLKHGEIQAIVAEADAQDPALVDGAFGPLAAELRDVMAGTPAEQEAWGNRVSTGAKKVGVVPAWKAAFERFGDLPAIRAVQIGRARSKYWSTALRDASRFGLSSELGAALAFDIAVQNGGVSRDERAAIELRLAALSAPDERSRREVVANVVAEASNTRFIEDVRARKLSFAAGSGTVHASRYELANWGLAEAPAGL